MVCAAAWLWYKTPALFKVVQHYLTSSRATRSSTEIEGWSGQLCWKAFFVEVQFVKAEFPHVFEPEQMSEGWIMQVRILLFVEGPLQAKVHHQRLVVAWIVYQAYKKLWSLWHLRTINVPKDSEIFAAGHALVKDVFTCPERKRTSSFVERFSGAFRSMLAKYPASSNESHINICSLL